MKKLILVIGICTASIAYSQNKSAGGLQNATNITPAIMLPGTTITEVFRFKPGLVTQLQSATNSANPFDFDINDRWFSLGEATAGAQTFYGSRFQANERALVQGYAGVTNMSGTTFSNNPRIQWIHNGGSTVGDLEFRVASSFTNGQSDLVATMTSGANTYFATTIPTNFTSIKPKVGISFEDIIGLSITTSNSISSGVNRIGASIEVNNVANGNGLIANCFGGINSTALFGKASGQENSIGVRGDVPGNSQFSAAIYGRAGTPGSNNFAGFFDGDVVITGNFSPSDAKLKNNITNENNVLEKISLLRPVTYLYKKTEGLSLPEINQHGFISQEMVEVFPELTKDITKPVFDEEGKIVSELSFKGINYTGLISVLTAGIQELNTELTAVRDELDEYKANDKIRQSLVQDSREVSDYSMEQNIPNPFNDRSIIRYQLAPDVNQASITIFNLNGGFVKEYPLDQNRGEITILASEIGKGMFIYSLTRNGQEIMSKRMIVR